MILYRKCWIWDITTKRLKWLWSRYAGLGSRCVKHRKHSLFSESALLGNVRFLDRDTAEGARRDCPSLQSEMSIFTWPDRCAHTSLWEWGWAKAAKQLEGLCLNSSSENAAALLGFGKGDGGEQQQQSLSQAVTQSLSQSDQLLHHGLSLTGCQSFCFTLRKRQQLQTMYYPA